MNHFSLTTAREAVEYVTSRADGARRVLFIASSGSGATLIARRFAAHLMPLRGEVLRHVAWIRYGARLYVDVDDCWSSVPSFRAPHHTCSRAALFGGGTPPRPGELALAHAGVLFLDELPEFREDVVRDILRGARPRGVLGYLPMMPQLLIATATPCACGHRGNPARSCVCTDARLANWQARLDALDPHFDHVVTLRLPLAELQQVGQALPLAI